VPQEWHPVPALGGTRPTPVPRGYGLPLDALSVVRIQRRKNLWRDRLARYAVSIDSVEVGRIGWGESQSFEVIPGHHTIKLRLQRFWSSKTLSLDIDEGGAYSLSCGPGPLAKILLTMTVMRDRYISLTEDEPNSRTTVA
jgi:hypothetical protein